jgi:hypothetical protein
MVEVFKTNVDQMSQACRLLSVLYQHFPESRINFDLEDCDRVLRVEGKNIPAEKVLTLVRENGFSCMELE